MNNIMDIKNMSRKFKLNLLPSNENGLYLSRIFCILFKHVRPRKMDV